MTCLQKKVKLKEKNKHPTILKLPDELWDEIKSIFPNEKPLKTVGRPITPYRKVIDGILYILRPDANGRCYPKNMDEVLPVIVDFRNGIALIYSKSYG
ncbi:MAG TPA: transposase [Candidatus Nitrosocosmicus sp.]